LTLVVDSSVVVAALIDSRRTGRWAEELVFSSDLVAPHIMPIEVANILRRASQRDQVSKDSAALAHADLLDLRVSLVPYESVADRAWELRDNLTMYDACYVATAEVLGASLATLDARLSRAPGVRCRFELPPEDD